MLSRQAEARAHLFGTHPGCSPQLGDPVCCYSLVALTSVDPPPQEPQAKGKAAPKSAPAKGPGSSISERNRAAAMARWHVASPPVTAPPSCRKCGLDLTGVAPSSGAVTFARRGLFGGISLF